MFGLEQLERLWTQPAGAGRAALAGLAHRRRHRFRRGRLRQLLPEPSRPRDALYRPQCAGRQPHRRGALKEAGITFDVNAQGNAVLGAPRTDGAGAHAAGGKGPAEQLQRRLRAVRQDGVHGPHVLHAGDHAGAGAGGRDCAHHPGHERREGARVCTSCCRTAGSFRRTRQQPSASVIIRTESADDISSGRRRSGISWPQRCRA